jgi:NDP-sugar pyrophosphorylase family protein
MLDLAHSVWSTAHPADHIGRVEIEQDSNYAFDLSVLETLPPASTELFLAFDERFGNFKRAELMQGAMARGFRLAVIRSPDARVVPGVRIGPNSFVGTGAVVEAGAAIDFNCVVHAGAIIGHRARVRASCWIEGGSTVGANAEIGAHVTLRTGTHIAPDVKVGRYSQVGIPGLYRTDIKPKTVLDPRYDEPIVVYGA